MNVNHVAREIDDENYRLFDDLLTFFTLAERTVNVPDFHFFDGAVLSGDDQVDICIESVGKMCGRTNPKGVRSWDSVANRIRPLKGAAIMTGRHETGARYEVIGGSELDYERRKKVIPYLNNYIKSYGVGDLSPFSSRILEIRAVAIRDDGTTVSNGSGYYYQRGDDWHPCWYMADKLDKPSSLQIESVAFSITIGWAAACKLRWRVAFRLSPEMPSMSMFTDPSGVRDFFRFRDIPEGKSRRDALRHWVTQHWRRDRHNEADEIYVREHLRGATEFRWHGMDVKINIPDCDIARVEAGRIERRRLSDAGLTRRLREARKAGKN